MHCKKYNNHNQLAGISKIHSGVVAINTDRFTHRRVLRGEMLSPVNDGNEII